MDKVVKNSEKPSIDMMTLYCDEELMRITLRQRTAVLTLGQLIDFFTEYGK